MANIEQIRTFLEVARAESFSQAAKALALPRSTVTARINALEERLGTRLLHRTTRSVSLTADGANFYLGCADAMDSLLKAEDRLVSSQTPQGTIKVSMPVDFPKHFMADLILDFQKTHPDVSFQLHVSDEAVDLISDAYDIAIRGRNPGSASLITRKIGSDKLLLLAPAGTDLARCLNDQSEPLDILDPTGFAASTLSVKTTARRASTNNFELARLLAIKLGIYVALPAGCAQTHIDAGDFDIVETLKPLPELPLYYVLPSRDFIPKRVRLFADFLTDRMTA